MNEVDPIRIVVIDRGFVLVGRCPDPAGVALWLKITDARVIRRWGTTGGLGELVSGPTGSTVMDTISPRESVPVRAILRVIEVEQAAWESHLSPSPRPTSSGRVTRRASS